MKWLSADHLREKSVPSRRSWLRSSWWIAVVYLSASVCWIIFTDELAIWITSGNAKALTHFQTMKGLLFVLLSSLLVYLLSEISHRQIEASHRKMRELDSQLKAALEATQDCLVIWDRDLRCLYANPAELRYCQLEANQLIGKKMEEALAAWPELNASRQRLVRQILESGQALRTEETITHRGKPCVHDLTLSPVRNEAGVVVHVVMVYRDITEKKQMERSLEENESRLRLAVRGVNMAFWEWDCQNGHFLCTDDLCGLYGVSREERPKTLAQFEKLLDQEDGPRFVRLLQEKQRLQDAVPFWDRHRVYLPDGQSRWIECTGFYAAPSGQAPERVLGLSRDITARHTLSLERQALQLRNQTLIKAFSEIVYECYPQQNKVLWEGEYTRTLGYSAEEMGDDLASSWTARIHPEDLPKVQQELELATKERRNFVGEYRFRKKDGSYLWGQTIGVLTVGEDGLLQKITGIFRDITRQKEADEQLRQALQASRQASQAKDEFLAVISHELRTPLNPILGYANILLGDCQKEPERSYLQTIIRAGERQLRLIENLLTFVRLGSSQMAMRFEECPLLATCQDVLAVCVNCEKQVEPEFINGFAGWMPVEADLIVRIPVDAFTLVLENLLSNACKFTPSGYVRLLLGQQPSSRADRGKFCLVVEDSGIGISPEFLDKIYTPFSQADSSYSRRYEGVGLGLAIVKKLVDLLGGTIKVVSELGQGTRFSVELEMEVLAPAPAIPIPPESVPPSLVFPQAWQGLVVEDREDNAALMKCMLEQFGASCDIVDNGALALVACRRQRYDFILMDLTMPVMDGFTAAHQIRNFSEANHNTPIIAISATVNQEVENRCREAGIVQVLAKPIDRHRLFQTILQVKSAKAAEPAGPSPAEPVG